MKRDHGQVLKTMFDAGLLKRQQLKSYHGQLVALQSDDEREIFLKKIIARVGRALV
jgi:hypothetical protein